MANVDYIIYGQGIAGTLLSRELLNAGKSLVVIDDRKPQSSSRVAGGLINPVTGKRVVKTWMIDTLLPVAIETYRDAEKEYGIPLLQQCNVLDFFESHEQRNIFYGRSEEEPDHLKIIDPRPWEGYFNFNYGVGEISPCFVVDIHALVDAHRSKLADSGMLVEEQFDWAKCKVDEGKVKYKDIEAEKLICCEGITAADDPYFSLLPFSKNKGEAIIASIPGLPRYNVYKRELKIMPWKDDLFWVGSSFAWKYEGLSPTKIFRERAEAYLQNIIKLPFEIVDHIASERPSTVDYKPFVGLHPKYPSVGIFNGMGTKGCSLAPYFAKEMAGYLTEGLPILPDADVARFSRILSRT